ncbi:bifunctional phosphoglucose/phosphomannose isomerase [Chloroflexota bacterium]
MESINLDDQSIYLESDPGDMRGRLRDLPQQCHNAWQLAGSFKLPEVYNKVNKVVILGMGGSAIGGDLIRSLAEAEAPTPMIIVRGYDLPKFVDENTLLIASSYSGNTEETLSALAQASGKGAKTLAITTGGKLTEHAKNENIPVFTYNYPAQPRAALGYSFFPILSFLQQLGFVTDKSAEVAETVAVLEGLLAKVEENTPTAQNPAKQMAEYLSDGLPVIYGAGIFTEVAHRWKTQINENSKAWAFYEALPELNHNAVVGFPEPPAVAQSARVIMLCSPLLGERLLLRYRVTAEILTRAGVGYQYCEALGQGQVAQLMSLVMLGDYASYYLGILYGEDPSPVAVIDYLKNELAKG